MVKGEDKGPSAKGEPIVKLAADADEQAPIAENEPVEPVAARPVDDDDDEEDEFIRGDLQQSIQEEEAAEPVVEEPETARSGDPRRPAQSAEDLMLRVVPARAAKSDNLLRRELVGSVLVSIRGTAERYLFDWTKDTATVEKTKSDQADCSLTVSEEDLMLISRGRLNPQIGMLSDKVQASGKFGLAVYFFNLVAPPQR